MGDLLVLCYHALSERWPAVLATPPARFRAQLELLLGRGYRGATLIDAVQRGWGERALVVTFDDAFRSVLELGKPILDDLGIPATVFAPTVFPGNEPVLRWPGIDNWVGGEYESELAPMNWSELAGLAAEGWEIGSHTVTHPYLTRLTDADLEYQLVESRSRCEAEIPGPCRTLAYPYGDHDARVAAAAELAGYEASVTLLPGLRPTSPHLWPRVGVYQADTIGRFKLKVSARSRQLRGHAYEWAQRRARGALEGPS